MKSQEQSYQLTIANQHQPSSSYNSSYTSSSGQSLSMPRVRHIYLQQQNIYGRFTPYLLLKDQLQSQYDSSGNTALHHMCSHNSPYIPLFLSSIPDNDPILNKRSKLGHTPLDVAGLYCKKQYVEMLKKKGAVDNGAVDYWAIQGGNIVNWSGKIYPQKKALIHWAAYNDMPQVIAEYAKQGVNVNQPDTNGFTPVDLAILNKSYNSLRVLVNHGQMPKQNLIKSTDSQSIRELFQRKSESQFKKQSKPLLKFLSLILFLGLCILLSHSTLQLLLIIGTIAVTLILLLRGTKIQSYRNDNRLTQFVSQLLMGKVINRRNHVLYLIIHMMVVVLGINSLIQCRIQSHISALAVLITVVYIVAYSAHLYVQIYAICRNLTYSEMFYSYQWPHLWSQLKYVEERLFAVKEYRNMEDRGIWDNVKNYYQR